MHICVIAGSHRVDSQSSKVGKYIARQIVALGATAELVDLRNNPLPLWSEEMWGRILTCRNSGRRGAQSSVPLTASWSSLRSGREWLQPD